VGRSNTCTLHGLTDLIISACDRKITQPRKESHKETPLQPGNIESFMLEDRFYMVWFRTFVFGKRRLGCNLATERK